MILYYIFLCYRPSLACLRTVKTGYALSVTFIPGDRHVLVGCKDGRLLIIDISAGDILEEIPAHTSELWSICLLPDQVSVCELDLIRNVVYFIVLY